MKTLLPKGGGGQFLRHELPCGSKSEKLQVCRFFACALFILFFVIQAANAQKIADNPVGYLRTDLVAPSATAGSLGRFGDASVNQSSGAPNFSIPIYTVSGHELSVPITLSYSYDGFRPSQPIGWTGLGWNLQAGGVISRQIKGRVDESSTGDQNFGSSYVQSRIIALGGYESNSMQTFLESVTEGVYDGEPDVFSFNFGGYSGKFTLVNGTYTIYPYQKLKISGGVGNFTITTEDGTKYYFSDAEYTSPKATYSESYNIPVHASSWYLTSVTNASNTETIRFLYTTDTQYAQVGTNTQTYKKVEDPSSGGSSQLYSPYYSFSSYIAPLRLTSIVSEKNTVTFSGTSSGRQDMSTASPALGGISITDNNSGDQLKSFKLNYEYFGASGSNFLYKYLKLKSIEEYPVGLGGNMANKQVHTFDYENENDSYPDKSNAFVDHYGYYAGGIFNSVMIPDYVYPGGPNRDPNPFIAKFGALKKITYPTGGNTSFEYEGNMGYNGIDYVKTSQSKNVYVARSGGDPLAVLETSPSSGTFTTNVAQTLLINVVRTPKSLAYDGIIKPDPGTSDAILFRLDDDAYTFVKLMALETDSQNSGLTFSVPITPGTYYVQVFADSKENGMSATWSYANNTSVPIEGATAGGLRIRRITNNPGIGLPTVKSYRYTDANGFSSGSPVSRVYDQKPLTEVTLSAQNQMTIVNSLNFSSFVSEGSNGGQPNYYRTVFEDLVGGTDTLTTRSDYVSFAGSFNGVQPLKAVQYKKTSGGLVPVKKTEYEYGEYGMGGATGLKAYKDTTVTVIPGGQYGGRLYHFQAELSMMSSYWLYTKKTREVSYEGVDSLVTVTNNSYDLADTKNLVMTRTTASNGDQLISKFKYPDSYTTGVSGAFTTAHILRPAWEQQVWRKTGTDSVLVSAGITEYSASSFKPVRQYALAVKGLNALNGEGMSGTKYSSLLSDSRYEERVAYGYDGAGRLVSQQLTGGIPVSYQWAYPANTSYSTALGQKNYVIAEAKNALPSEFYHENFEEYSGASSGTAHTGDKFYSGDFYVSWSIPNARAYVLSYWYRDGGTWKYQEQAYTGAVTLALGDAIDDVRIHPKDAQLGTYVYKSGIGISASTDAKGLTTYSEFDEFNRLKNVKDQDGNIVKSYEYNLAHETFYNDAVSGSFTKNNCSSGTGTSVTYTIPANTYSASSKAAANALANAALANGGQAYANANGTCSGVATTAISYVNYTTPYTPTGPNSADVSSLVIKDGSGTTLYTYNTAQLQAGISVPQGTYTFVITVSGMTWDWYTDLGWASCYLNTGSYWNGFDNATSSYTLTGVTLTAPTATLYLDKYIF
ncbi:DUF5977 domain-containing protein [Pedobacter sp. ASV12]|uniref:DUF5977 domain-containing protein n=1 Tax=Pedobacter sp. ASV12 TaxID=2795120 RepID=UPI0018EAEBB7|nr:DUF5977 domain-containing protein [Pedobacter sp. ASV12]